MISIMENLNDQITSCKKLLKIFQEERTLYRNRSSIGIKEVMDILKRKKLLVEAFGEQQQIMREIKAQEKEQTAPPKEKTRELLRELSEVLEQLLVIDQENEKLLRNILSSRDCSSSRFKASSFRARPALQRQLPFVPGGRSQAAAIATPAVKPEVPQKPEIKVPASTSLESPKQPSVLEKAFVSRPKSHLRGYHEAARILQTSSALS
jgi:flagellar biosynthesis/type III secretory pathway chaperone